MNTDSLWAAFAPIPPECNPHVAAARDHLDRWVTEQGVVLRPLARERFTAADFGWFAAVTHPSADETGLCLIADWFAWLFLLDDQLDDGLLGRDPGRTGELLAMMFDVLRGTPPPPDAPALVGALADLWRRTAEPAGAAWRQRFVDHVIAGGMAAGWEADNRARGVVPDEQTYVERRRHTGAIYVCLDLVEVVGVGEVPGAAYADERFERALRAACDVVCWTNDLYSHDKEASLGECHNLVAVVRHGHGLDVAGALDLVTERVVERVADYLRFERAAVEVGGPEVAGCLAGMRSWMRGNLDWSARTRRYRDAAVGSYVESELVGRRP
ncbi:Pentalenene synthase (PS) (Sesquiterpene synthase) (Sesquiterpene cyclase) [Actinokineospora spheciospongiae]|uniref:Terpene synthase n=1 Tax=Actinokineospora spheciospongiae TaxID=909613 RepID=W7IVU7_9PSEU|nr:hypothetical protein [Actinokineospora spheciospongiae]EWC58124.1 Pentalenene synthase (PS) (Sesquiterpene synthase) (Sesquiterpene cyclase) [Actinokineospora spheciospongiae]